MFVLNLECNIKLNRITRLSKTSKLTFNWLKQKSIEYKIREKGILKDVSLTMFLEF